MGINLPPSSVVTHLMWTFTEIINGIDVCEFNKCV